MRVEAQQEFPDFLRSAPDFSHEDVFNCRQDGVLLIFGQGSVAGNESQNRGRFPRNAFGGVGRTELVDRQLFELLPLVRLFAKGFYQQKLAGRWDKLSVRLGGKKSLSSLDLPAGIQFPLSNEVFRPDKEIDGVRVELAQLRNRRDAGVGRRGLAGFGLRRSVFV